MHHAAKLFNRRSAYRADGQSKFATCYEIKCRDCGAIDEISINRITNSLPPDVLAGKFRQKGWVIGQTRSNDVCPACVGKLVDDRRARQVAKSQERTRANQDAVITEARLAAAEPTHPPVSDISLSRQQLVLLDRAAELHRAGAYISTMLETLMDKVAELEKGRETLFAKITETTHQPIDHDVVPEMVGTNGHGSMQNASVVHIAHYLGGGYPQTVIILSNAIATELGVGIGDLVTVNAGEGEHEGIVRVAKTNADNVNGFVVNRAPSGISIRVTEIKPKHGSVHVTATDCRWSMAADGLYCRLPDAFMEPPNPPSTDDRVFA